MKKQVMAILMTMLSSLGIAETPTVDWEHTNFIRLYADVISQERTLLLSDSPEYVQKKTGILYRGTVIGPSRVYFYHVNESQEKRKVAVIVHNKNFQKVNITFERYILAKPSPDYFKVGRELSAKELQHEKRLPETVRLDPGERRVLYKQIEDVVVKPDELFSGLVDFSVDREVEVSVVMIQAIQDVKSVAPALDALPHDEVHLRGTYVKQGHRHFKVTSGYRSDVGAAYLELANNEDDKYVQGYDEISQHMAVTNRGNYGVSSIIEIPTQGKNKFDLFFNPMGGAYAGSMAIIYDGKETIIDLPDKKKHYIGNNTIYDTLYIGRYEGGKTITIRFMPPGASNLPVRLLFIPVPEKERFFANLWKGKSKDAKV